MTHTNLEKCVGGFLLEKFMKAHIVLPKEKKLNFLKNALFQSYLWNQQSQKASMHS